VKNILLLLPLALIMAGCQDVYRYPCQDPENWNNDYCNSNACVAAGACTVDVMGPDKAANEKLMKEYNKTGTEEK
jgi:hypothetical protein